MAFIKLKKEKRFGNNQKEIEEIISGYNEKDGRSNENFKEIKLNENEKIFAYLSATPRDFDEIYLARMGMGRYEFENSTDEQLKDRGRAEFNELSSNLMEKIARLEKEFSKIPGNSEYKPSYDMSDLIAGIKKDGEYIDSLLMPEYKFIQVTAKDGKGNKIRFYYGCAGVKNEKEDTTMFMHRDGLYRILPHMQSLGCDSLTIEDIGGAHIQIGHRTRTIKVDGTSEEFGLIDTEAAKKDLPEYFGDKNYELSIHGKGQERSVLPAGGMHNGN